VNRVLSLSDIRDRRAAGAHHFSTAGRLVGLGLVVLLHVVLIYALVNALARRTIEVVHAPIETKIIEEVKPPPQEPPPPPPPEFKPPPPAFVPPPEVHIETPPPPQNTAITAVTPVAPPPKAAPVRVLPRVDVAHSQQPEYPPDSRRAGEEGSLILQVLVDPNGRVLDSKLEQSSGSERLDQAALQGVKTSYRFIPGTVDGKPQEMWYTFKFTWKLR
jgi:periplasmic protein TonB